MNRKLLWIVPFAYFFRTRVTTRLSQVSWSLIYCLPICLLVLSFGTGPELTTSLWLDLGLLLAAMSCTYCIYELGYMQNDVATVRTETNPTPRLSAEESAALEQHWPLVLLSRLVVAGVLLWLCSSAPGWSWYVISIIALAIVFPIYNYFRSKVNAGLHFILVSLRFCGPLMLVEPDVLLLILGLITFPVINSLERAAEPRYGFTGLQHFVLANQTSGRWIYYLLASLGWIAFCVLCDFPTITVATLVYLFLYRLVSPLFVGGAS